jgi:TIR domain
MTSVFISYSQDKADPAHAERVARLAASLMQDGLTVFLDQNRGDEEEKLAWEIWMENQIEKADYVLVVCTELYLKKVRQEVPPTKDRECVGRQASCTACSVKRSGTRPSSSP